MKSSDTKKIIKLLQSRGIELATGLTDEEFKYIETETGVLFPDDYKLFLQTVVPIGRVNPPPGHFGGMSFPDWKNDPIGEINKARESIKNSFKFDIENNNDFWLDDFGHKPERLEDAVRQALDVVEKTPSLIPVFGHRFIPSSPSSAGNPIFSMHQPVDTIIYGSNLLEFFQVEFKVKKYSKINFKKVRQIPFWSKLL